MKGIILHGGKGTRLRPLTNTGPKQLIPIAGKAISQYVVEDLKDSGITDIAIVLGDVGPERVREYYGDGDRFGVHITYVDQGKPAGISQAIGLCREFVGTDRFVVYLGDNLLKGGIPTYVREFQESQSDLMLLLTRVKNPQSFGVAEFDGGKLVRLVEKPKYPKSPYAVTGIYFCTPELFRAIDSIEPSKRGELEITDAIQLMIEKADYRIVEGWWKDTGTAEDIIEANRFVLSKNIIEDGASIKGATIASPCFIGTGTTIDSKSEIGPYASIGRGCFLEGVSIENSIVMDNCNIRRCPKKITDSIIGKFTQIEGDSDSTRLLVGEDCQITL